MAKIQQKSEKITAFGGIFWFIRLIDYGPGDEGEFSTLYDHPDTVIFYKIEKFLVHLNLDIDFVTKKLAEWGITKVLLYGHYDKPVGIDVFFDAFKKQYENNDEEIVIQDGDKEIRFRNPIWFKEGEDSEETD